MLVPIMLLTSRMIISSCIGLLWTKVFLSSNIQGMRDLNYAVSRDNHFLKQNSETDTLQSNWHPSFLLQSYEGIDSSEDVKEFYIRQVPGDGGCLFHALAACLSYEVTDKHFDFDSKLRCLSSDLRKLSISVLNSSFCLLIENGVLIQAHDLLQSVSDHYNLTKDEYLKKMSHPKAWGGGPEIAAISNILQVPIHVYQLEVVRNRFHIPFWNSRRKFRLKSQVEIGSPLLDNHCEPFRILCCDGSFPDVKPGKQKEIGDHFLAMFPKTKAQFKNSDIVMLKHFKRGDPFARFSNVLKDLSYHVKNDEYEQIPDPPTSILRYAEKRGLNFMKESIDSLQSFNDRINESKN